MIKQALFWLLMLASVASREAHAVVWADADAEPPTTQSGPFRHTGRMLYTRLGVCGGSCVWAGGRWVLTARHGVDSWSAGTLRVDFPAHSKDRHGVKAIHLPADAKVDLALLELEQPLRFEDPPVLSSLPLAKGMSIQLGGYGKHGPAGTASGASRFHWGTNTIDSANDRTARFTLDAATPKTPREALPALFDSGSPVFLVDGERLLLAGVSVRVSHGDNPRVGDHAVMTCLAEQADWIKKTAPSIAWRERPSSAAPQRDGGEHVVGARAD